MLPHFELQIRKINGLQNVSRETIARLDEFVALLLKWNRSINLVSKSHKTPEDIWQRHILDSAQLVSHIPQDAKVITDFGSGGGFPAVILAILGPWEVHMLESDQRKCAFLLEATRHLPNKIVIHNERIEKVPAWETDVVTARALAPLVSLLEMVEPFCKKNKICLFLKGQNVVEEIKDASICWDFQSNLTPSMTSNTGSILTLSHVKKKESQNEHRQ